MNKILHSHYLLLLGLAGQSVSWYWLRQPYLEQDFGWPLGAVGYLISTFLLVLFFKREGNKAWTLFAIPLVFIFDWCVVYALEYVEAVYQPTLSGIGWGTSCLLTLVGEESRFSNGTISLNGLDGLVRVTPTFGLVGMNVFSLLIVKFAVAISVVNFEKKVPTVFWAALVMILIGVVRFTIAILLYSSTPDLLAIKGPSLLTYFWSGWSIAFFALLWVFIVGQTLSPSDGGHRVPVLGFRSICYGVILGLLISLSLSSGELVSQGKGRVLVDDRLSGTWEPAGRLLTPERFGDFSAYSFSSLTEGLSHRFPVTVNSSEKYSQDLLSSFDILVIKTPEKKLEHEEVNAIQEWVKKGGGLYVIGDHTDLMGMSSHLNILIEGSGIQFSFDATGSAAEGGFDYWTPPIIPEHPISLGLGTMEFMTPCSLELSGEAVPVITARASESIRGDYSMNSNFGTLAANASNQHGLLVFSATATLGRGRIAAFSDSTVFSSFAVSTWGHQDVFYRTIAWLNQDARELPIWIIRVLGVLGVVWVLGTLRREQSLGFWLFLGVFPGLLLGVIGKLNLDARQLIVPPVSEDVVRTAFISNGAHAWFPAVLGSQPTLPDAGNFSTFIQIPLRLGYEVEVLTTEQIDLGSFDQLVLINPELGEEVLPGNSAEWIESVLAWVRNGGSLIILSRQLHESHDHNLAPSYLNGIEMHEANHGQHGSSVKHAKYGSGAIVYVIGSGNFTVSSMGHCMDYPNPIQQARYNEAYRIFGPDCGIPSPNRKTYTILD